MEADSEGFSFALTLKKSEKENSIIFPGDISTIISFPD